MLKCILSGMMVTLLLAGALVLALGVQLARSESRTIVVPDGYATIQEAINAANPGDTIYVRARIYYEHVVVNKTVSLIGESRLNTVIDGGGVGNVVRIEADDVHVGGFTVRGGGSRAGIRLYYADRCSINDSIITSNLETGILFFVSTYNIIENSEVSNNYGSGIDVGDTGSHHNTIRNNVVYQNGGDYGIDAYAGSGYTIIEDNIVYNNAWIGIGIGWSSYCVIRNNRLYNTNASGVVLDTTSHCTVVNNNISYSYHGGITLLGLGTYYNNLLNNTVCFCGQGIGLGASARYTEISDNVLSENEYGLTIERSPGYENYGNTIFHNNFINNEHQAVDKTTGTMVPNVWDESYPSGGNYWSDYAALDEKSGPNQDLPGRDGIADMPYVINASAQDDYPLMNPWIPKEIYVKVKGVDYLVTMSSNATITEITSTPKSLNFTASEMPGNKGYFLIVFPNVNTTKLRIYVDGVEVVQPPFPVINYNGSHYFIYFEVTFSTHKLVLLYVPEVPLGIILALTAMFAPLGGLAIFKRAWKRNHAKPSEDTSINPHKPA